MTNGKIRKKTKSKQRDDQGVLPKISPPRVKVRPRLPEDNTHGDGPKRWCTTSTGKATPKTPETNSGSKAQAHKAHRVSTLSIGETAKIASKFDRFKMKAGVTYCNQFCHYVAQSVGCEDFKGLLASQMVDFCDENPDKWMVMDGDQAQTAANSGQLVLAGWKNPDPKGHGHVSIVIPGKLTWSKQFKDDVPIVANVGKSNFYGRPVSYAFRKTMPPRYWMWLGEINGTA